MRASFNKAKIWGAIITNISRIENAVAEHRDLFARELKVRSAAKGVQDSKYDTRWDSSSHKEVDRYLDALTSLKKKKNLLDGTDQEKISLSENEYDLIITQEYPPLHTPEYVQTLESVEIKIGFKKS